MLWIMAGDGSSRVLDARVLPRDPREELVDEGARDELPARVSLRGCQVGPFGFEVESHRSEASRSKSNG
jgi:hypothetical protein